MPFPVPGRVLPLGPDTFRALAHRDFRLLWLGQLVSLSGSWMQSLAQGWLVLRLTSSPFHLGLIGFLGLLPVTVLALPAGVVADRWPRRQALIWVQASAMVLVATLALLTWLGRVEFWHVALLALGLGIVGAIDIPVRQSFLLDLVGPADLPNAIALNSLAFNAARFIGPAAAGLILARYGEAPIFLLNALSFMAVLAGLLLMRTAGRTASPPARSWVAEIRLGLAHAWADRRMRLLLAVVVATSVLAMPYSVLLPIFARDLLAAGPRGLGLLMGSAGAGAMGGALFVAGRKDVRRAGGTIAAALTLLGLGLATFALAGAVWIAAAGLFVVGGAIIVQMATSNTVLQLISPAALRGRVISLYMLAFMGMAPLGSLLAGLSAPRYGARATVLAGAVGCLLVAVWFIPRAATIAPAAA